MTLIFITCFALIFLLGIIYFIVGNSVPDSFFNSTLSLNLQKICIGYGIFAVIQGLFFVYSIPYLLEFFFIFFLFFGVYRLIKYNKKNIFKLDFLSLFLPFSFFLIVFTPFFFGAIFFGNVDPGDLHGYAVGYLKEGSWAKLHDSWRHVGTNASPWEGSGEQYSFSDYRLAVAFDYLVFSVRWGMPVIANWVNQNFHQDVYVGILVSSALPFFLAPLLVYDFFKKKFNLRCSSITFFLTFLSFGISTPVLLWHEGLLNHVAVLPIFILMLLTADDLLEMPNLKKILIFSLLYVASITIWSEASILIAIYLAIYVFFILIERERRLNYSDYIKRIIILGILIFLCSFLIFPEALIDFIYLCFNRIKHHYPPGILAFDWSFLDIFLPFPLVWVDAKIANNIQLIFNFSKYQRIIEAIIFLGISFWFYSRDKGSRNLFIVAIIIFLFSILNKPYIYWNVVTLLMPLIVYGMYAFIKNIFPEYSLKSYCIIISILGLSFTQFLQYRYAGISQSIKPNQFSLDETNLKSEKKIAILTPSEKNGYLRYGWNHDFHWLNKRVSWFGQNVQFRNNDKSLIVAYYYDCEIEGAKMCEIIKRTTGLSERKIYLSNLRVSEILDVNGRVLGNNIITLKESFFGARTNHE
jgi:hypothetical protein